jgi:transposase InsO family protein
MVGPAAKRAAVAHLQDTTGLSERRACLIVGADRKTVRYCSRRPPDTELRARLRELANERRRFGYRRLFILLRREGEPSGINRIHRLYREEELAVRKRRARRKARLASGCRSWWKRWQVSAATRGQARQDAPGNNLLSGPHAPLHAEPKRQLQG